MTRLLRWTVALLLVAGASGANAQGLTVFAASSLTDAFTALARAFEAAHPGTRVALDFASSSTLATQILQGAPADVFASANRTQVDRIVAAGLQRDAPSAFAGNRLVILTPERSTITSLADLARPGTLLVLAAPQVPAGGYADALLDAAASVYGTAVVDRIRANVVSREPNVRQTAAKVALGAADAAIVYATDARGLRGVRAVALPSALQPVIVYPLILLRGGSHPDEATAFRAFVLSPAGRAALASFGFAPPP